MISNNNYHYGYTSGGAQTTLVGIKSNNYVTIGQLNANNVGTDIYGGTGNIYLYSGSENRLTVSSDVNVQGATDLNINGPSRRLSFTSGTGTIRTTTSNKLFLQTNSTDALTIDTSQNVGIGTTSPSQKLHVNLGRIAVTDGYNIGDTDADTGMFPSSNALFFQTAGTTRAAITSAGNVGIGTSSPTLGKLQVAGRGYFGPVGTGDATTKALMDTYSVLKLKPHDSNSTNMTFAQVNSGNAIGIQVTNSTQTADWDIALNPYGGNVGIGTDSPSQKLDVIGRIRSSFNSGDYFEIGSSDSGGFVVGKSGGTEVVNVRTYGDSYFNGGNFGIGTTSPSAKLHVLEASAGSFAFDGTADTLIVESNGNGGITIATAAANTGRIIFASPNDATGAEIKFSDATDLMTIGTTTPNADLALQAGNGVEAVRILDDGSVGINETSPSYGLEVNGTAHVTGAFSAGSKSFLIDHPTKENHMLQYGSLEGPEFGVYVRGKTDLSEIELPEVWIGLVHEGSITVSFTPRGKFLPLFLNKIENNTIYVGGTEGGVFYDYVIYGTRKDVDDLVTEFTK